MDNMLSPGGVYSSGKSISKAGVRIRPISNFHDESVVRMADSVFGAGYITTITMLSSRQLLYGAYCGNDLIGFAYGNIPGAGSLNDVLKGKGDMRKLPLEIVQSDQHGLMGVLQTVAVDPIYEFSSVEKQLLTCILSALYIMGAQCVISIDWVNSVSGHSTRILQNAGFMEFCRLANFWHDDSLRLGYRCPECGNPCHCSAIAYLLSQDNLFSLYAKLSSA